MCSTKSLEYGGACSHAHTHRHTRMVAEAREAITNTPSNNTLGTNQIRVIIVRTALANKGAEGVGVGAGAGAGAA